MNEWKSMTKAKLVKLASELGLEVSPDMNRAKLIEAIEVAQIDQALQQNQPKASASPQDSAAPQASDEPSPELSPLDDDSTDDVSSDDDSSDDDSSDDDSSDDVSSDDDSSDDDSSDDDSSDDDGSDDDGSDDDGSDDELEPSTVDEEPERHPHEGEQPLLTPLNLGGIPLGYDRTYLGLMVQTPTTLFCYWSFANAETTAVFHQGLPVEVRLYDLTEGEELPVRSESIDIAAGRWFIHSLPPDRRYRAELGLVHAEGFQAVLRSSVVQAPPKEASRISDEIWVTLQQQTALKALPRDLRARDAGEVWRLGDWAGASELDHVASRTAAHGPTRHLPSQPAPDYYATPSASGPSWVSTPMGDTDIDLTHDVGHSPAPALGGSTEV